MSVWLPTAPCTPETCVGPLGPVVSTPRRVGRIVGCVAVLALGIACTPVVRISPWLPQERLVRAWSRLVIASLGVRLRPPADGAGPTGGSLLVANHVSWLDILLIAAVRPGRMLAKTEVRQWPVLGPLVGWSGTLFVDRDRLRELPEAVRRIADALRRDERVVVFPEGSTWCGRAGGRFRPAAFQAAIDAGVPVQPVSIGYQLADGTATTAPAFVGEDGLLSSLRRVVAVRGLVAEVTLLPAIPSGQYPARKELARAAQSAVDHQLVRPEHAHATAA